MPGAPYRGRRAYRKNNNPSAAPATQTRLVPKHLNTPRANCLHNWNWTQQLNEDATTLECLSCSYIAAPCPRCGTVTVPKEGLGGITDLPNTTTADWVKANSCPKSPGRVHIPRIIQANSVLSPKTYTVAYRLKPESRDDYVITSEQE